MANAIIIGSEHDRIHRFISHQDTLELLALTSADKLSPDATKFLQNIIKSSESIFKRTNAASPAFLPSTDLWDACLLDYYLVILWWVTSVWIPLSKKPTSEEIFRNYEAAIKCEDDKDGEALNNATEKKIEPCALLASALLIGHFLLRFLWEVHSEQIQPDECVKAAAFLLIVRTLGGFSGREVKSKSSADVPAFQLARVEIETNSLTGILSFVSEELAKAYLEFFSNFFIRHYQLFSSIFGGHKRVNRNQVIDRKHFHFERLPSSTGEETTIWPPPLYEALPQKLIRLYPNRFKPELIHILDIINPPVNSTESHTNENVEHTAMKEEPQKNDVRQFYKGQEVDLSDVSFDMLEDLSAITLEDLEQAVAEVSLTLDGMNISINYQQRQQSALELLNKTREELKSRKVG